MCRINNEGENANDNEYEYLFGVCKVLYFQSISIKRLKDTFQ